MKTNRLAQVNIDFILTFIVILSIFLALTYASSLKYTQMNYETKENSAELLATKLATNINSIYLVGNGAKKEVLFPPTLIDNTEYTMTIYPTEQLVEIVYFFENQNRSYSYPLLTNNISGKTSNIFNTINITNIDGGILIE